MITNISTGYEPTRQQFYLTWIQDGKMNYFYSPLRYVIEDKRNELMNLNWIEKQKALKEAIQEAEYHRSRYYAYTTDNPNEKDTP